MSNGIAESQGHEPISENLRDMPHSSYRGDRYSITRAIASAIRRGSGKPDGLEGEVSTELAIRMNRDPKGFFLPLDAPVERRIDSTITGSGAAATVWPPLMFIDVLRAKLVVAALGGQVTTFSRECGTVQMPVQTAATPVTWVTEGTAAGSFTGLTIGSVTFVPHTALVNTGITRFMRDLSAPGFDAWLYGSIAKDLAVSIDGAAVDGAGTTAGQPLGLSQNPAVPTYTLAADSGNGGAPAYADLVGMEEAIGNANADSRADARLGWLTSPNGRSKLRRVDASSGNAGHFLWDKNFNTVLGYPAQTTTNLPSNFTKGSGSSLTSLVHGDWSNLAVNLFSAVDILLNPFTITAGGYYQLYAYQEADVQLLRAAGFIIANGMVTS